MVEIVMDQLCYSKIYKKDLIATISNVKDIGLLAEKSILITGSTGLVGSYVIDTLLYANAQYNLNIKILACGRNIEALKKRFLHGVEHIKFIEYDVTTGLVDNDFEALDYIIHAASNAHPEAIYNDPVGTITANVQGTYYLLKLAQRFPKCRFLFVSSGEVYGLGNGSPFKEDYVGYLDIATTRSSYPMSKRCAENLCVSYSQQYGVDTLIVRLCHTFGPNNLLRDSRATAQFIKSAIVGENIVLNSTGESIRSYLYVSDTASGILQVLVSGERENIYNISSSKEISIREMAEIIGKIAQVRVTYNITNEQASPFSYAVLDNSKIVSLGWKPKFSFFSGLEHTFHIARESAGSNVK